MGENNFKALEIISVHVPKTAGMAFKQILTNVYGSEHVLLDYPSEPRFDPLPSIDPTKTQVIHGHFLASRYKGHFPEAKRIIWFRHPVQRLVSHYFFLKDFAPETNDLLHQKILHARMSLAEFAQYPGVSKFLCQFVKDVKLSDFYFIGIQEFFREDIDELRSDLNWSNVKVEFQNYNQHPKYNENSQQVYSDPELYKYLESLVSEDMQLYEQALNLRAYRRASKGLDIETLKGFSQNLFKHKVQMESLQGDSIKLQVVSSQENMNSTVKDDKRLILEQYVSSVPTPQNALDILKEEWHSKLPGNFALLKAGEIPLFSDSRLHWAIEKLGGISKQKILELGPLEGGHTYMLEQADAAEIISVEANTRAYVKCLIVKEILKLQRVQFLCGDFVEYLRAQPGKFDTTVACGVLYHMINPVELISLIAAVSDRLYLWTHYFDFTIISSNPVLTGKFHLDGVCSEYLGFKHTLYRQEYQSALDSVSFCGGSRPFSHWMSREDILRCLDFFGLGNIQIQETHDTPGHPNGPSFSLVATRI